MKVRVLAFGLVCLSLFILISGCGGGGDSGSSFSSSWLGVTTDPNSTGTCVVMPSAVSLRPGQIISVAVLVKDSYGHPLDAANVQLSSLLGGTFEEQSGETVKGWFSTRFTAGTKQGTESITALAKGALGSKSLLIQPSAAKAITVKLVTSADTVLAENPITLAVGVSTDGAPAEETDVFLSSTLPGKFDADSGKVVGGWFSTLFTPNAEASGIGTITAMVNEIKTSASLNVVKQKKATPLLSISVSPDAIFQGQTAAVIVIAKDAAGFPSSANVNLFASLDGSFTPQSGVPEDGVFFAEFTAGKEIGSATLTVSSIENASASTVLAIEKPNIVMKISPSVNSVKINEKVPVSVLVTDEFYRPIEKAPIHLLAELGCSCEPDTGETNDNGYLFVDFIASKTVGISTIHALTEGATSSAQITVVGP